ncbi:hypothetical protein J5834_02850, partial [bacterium]|nr:hypothetical protein [bacterium]
NLMKDLNNTVTDNSVKLSERDIRKMLVNIGDANKRLKDQLVEFTKGYKLFYEAKEPAKK